MLTQEDDVDAHALQRQGWTIRGLPRVRLTLVVRRRSPGTQVMDQVRRRVQQQTLHPARTQGSSCRRRRW